MCVLSVYPWLPLPKGSISRLHLFEGFLIWGLGQPQSTVPSSIIPAEEQRGGEEGVERRKKTGGDGVISYLSSLSPTRPIASNCFSLHLFHLSVHLPFPISFPRCSSIYRALLSLCSFYSHLHSERHPVAPAIPMSVCLFICLSDCLTSVPTVVPFVSADKWGWPFIVKQTPTGRDETASV